MAQTIVEAAEVIASNLTQAKADLTELRRMLDGAVAATETMSRVEQGLDKAVKALEGYVGTFQSLEDSIDEAVQVIRRYRQSVEDAGAQVTFG
jgi:methyl-accepting chemotaxis protein